MAKEQPNEIVVGIAFTYQDGHVSEVDAEIVGEFEDFRYKETGAEAIEHLISNSNELDDVKAEIESIREQLRKI